MVYNLQTKDADLKSFNVEMEVAFPEISSAIETMSVLMDLMNSTVVCSFIQFSLVLIRVTEIFITDSMPLFNQLFRYKTNDSLFTFCFLVE